MQRTIKLAALSICLTVWAGCGISGRWAVYQVEPESARGHFELAEAELKSDHTYRVESTYGGQTLVRTGRWSFQNGKLTFSGDDGRQREYDAKLLDGGKRLQVTTAREGSDIVAILTRS